MSTTTRFRNKEVYGTKSSITLAECHGKLLDTPEAHKRPHYNIAAGLIVVIKANEYPLRRLRLRRDCAVEFGARAVAEKWMFAWTKRVNPRRPAR